MKLKSFLLMALAASTTLAACDKSENSGLDPDKTPKSVTITLPNLDTRATGHAQAANEASLKNLKIFFLAGETALADADIPQYNGEAQPVFFGKKADGTTATTIPETRTFTYHFLPASITAVVVVGNVTDENADYATAIADKNVLNDGDAGIDADANGHPYYPLYGRENLTLKAGTDSEGHNNVYTASVEIAPQIARFEIYGFEYKPNEDATFSYDALELDKIALSNYSTQYNLASGNAVDAAVVCPTVTAEIWGWINNAAEPWANKFTAFSLAQNDKVFVTDNTKGEAIPADNTQGDDAQNIVTYGLTKAANAAENPELLLSFYGIEEGQQKTPHYLRGKFTTSEAFQPGKIYRVLFSITDGSWDNPERCIELTVTVKEWVIVPVTPEFE